MLIETISDGRTCRRCGETKPLSAFRSTQRQPNYKRHYDTKCKPCLNSERRDAYQSLSPAERAAFNAKHREARHRFNVKRKFGLSRAEYEQMVADSGGLCAICKRPSGRRRLAVDHDHATGKVRGLLCARCNIAIGHLRDDVPTMEAAIAYVKGASHVN